MLEANLEARVACALLPAMRSGAGIDLAGPLSARLLSALPTVVDILKAWSPGLRSVSFPGLLPQAGRRSSAGRVGAFFSGGVDSCYTLLALRGELTDLVFVHGFDIPLEDQARLRRAAARVEVMASDFGVGVVHVEANLKPVLKSFGSWGYLGHGLALATIGHLLSPAFERLYVPATRYYSDLGPWGSHPLLDPLWSSELVEFVHHGAGKRRVEKLELLAGFDALLGNLRVCFTASDAEYNCGRCEKCLRTMLALEAFGKLSECKAFELPFEAARVARLTVPDINRPFYQEVLETLRQRGIRPDLQRAIAQCLRRPTRLARAARRARRLVSRLTRGRR